MQFISVWRTGVGVMPFQVRTRPALHIGAVIVSLFLSFIRHLSAKRTKYPPFIRQI